MLQKKLLFWILFSVLNQSRILEILFPTPHNTTMIMLGYRQEFLRSKIVWAKKSRKQYFKKEGFFKTPSTFQSTIKIKISKRLDWANASIVLFLHEQIFSSFNWSYHWSGLVFLIEKTKCHTCVAICGLYKVAPNYKIYPSTNCERNQNKVLS